MALTGQAVGGMCANCLLMLALTPPREEAPPSALPSENEAAPDGPMPIQNPKVRYFGDYELLEEIDRGGMGVVYKARQASLNRVVALKMILAGGFSSAATVERFQTEAEAAARLEHPNIVPIYEIGTHEGQHYFSMRFVEGATLTKAMAAEKFSPRRAAELVVKVARAVHHAHQHGILHRDLKPGNILLDQASQPHVVDFGLAKLLEHDSALTQSATVMGTPSYMAPEQAAGQTKQLSTVADVYSLGAILYELLTGRAPFRGATPAETMRQVIEVQPEPPRRLNPAVDRDLETICLKCLEKEPHRRYGSSEGLAEDLERWLRGEPVLVRPASRWEAARKWARRKPAIAALTAVVVFVTGAGLAGVFWQWQEAELARRIAETKARAETDAKAIAEQERENAQRAYAQAAAALEGLELQKAEEVLREDKAATALAYFARMVRDNPSNHVAAERIMATLAERSFVFPTTAPPLTRSNQTDRSTFSPDGRWMLATASNTVQVFEARNNEPAVRELKHKAATRVSSAHFSPDSRCVVTVSTNPERQPNSHRVTIRLWDLLAGQAIGDAPAPRDNIQFHAFSPDSRWFMTSSAPTGERVVQLWDAQTGQPVFNKSFPPAPNGWFQFSFDERRVFVTYLDGVHVWDYRTGQVTVQQIGNPGVSDFRTSLLSPDRERLLTTSWVAAQIWQLSTGRLLAEIPFGRSANYSPRGFSSDGQRVLVVADTTAGIWDAATGWPLGERMKDAGRIRAAQFAANGQWIITIGANVRVWDGHTGLPVTEPLASTDVLGNPFSVSTASLSPDGRRLTTVFMPDDGQKQGKVGHWEIRLGYDGLGLLASGSPAGSARADASLNVGSNSPSPPNRVPDWLPELAEAVAGQRLSDKRVIEFVPVATRLKLRQRLSEAAGEDLYTRWAQWYFANLDSRPLTPFSTNTIQDYVRQQLQGNRVAGLYKALRLEPTNGVLMARLAGQLLEQSPRDNPRQAAEADYFSRRALAMAPDQPAVIRVRSEVLASRDQLADALKLLETAVARWPLYPDLRHDQGAILERVNRFADALHAYSRAIELAAAPAGRPEEEQASYLLKRSELLRRQQRTEEAEADHRAALALLATVRAQDWPMWGGSDPGRNMYSPATGLPATFRPGRFHPGSETVDLATTENLKWAAKLGSVSLGSPIVAGGRVFIGTNNDDPKDGRHQGDRSVLLCLDEKQGGLLWQLVVPKLKSGKVNDWENMGLMSSPAIEGNRVYLASTRCEVLCLTTEGLARGNVGPFCDEGQYFVGPDKAKVLPGSRDADIVWRYDMIGALSVFPHHATFNSPLILGDLIYMNTCNGQDWTHTNVPSPLSPSLIAVNKHTGELAGEDDAGIGPRIFHGQWSSPSAGRVNDKWLIFFGGGDGMCYAFDATPVKGENSSFLKTVWKADCNPPEYKSRNGKPIKYPAAEGPSEINATPVFWNNRVYVAIGQDPEHGEGVGNLVCLDATQTGDITKSGLIWSYRDIHRSLSTVSITPDGLLFIVDFSGFVHCLDAQTGQFHWKHDLKSHVWGSTLVADGKVYVGDEDGDFVTFAASKEKNVLSWTIVDGGQTDCPNLGAPIYSTPVAANGVLFVATSTHLFAIHDARAKGPPVSGAANPSSSW